MSDPRVFAGYMKDTLAALEERGCRSELAALDPTLHADVEAASRVAWLPIGINVRMVDAVVDARGAEAGLALLADCVYAQFDRPLWKDFIGGAIRLLGRDPGSLGRWIPKALQLIFRSCGQWSAQRSGETELEVAARDLPPELAPNRLWLESIAVGMTPVFTLCGVSGESTLEALDSEQATARFALRWKPQGGA